MALLTQSSLGSDFDRPNGIIGDPVSPNDPISLPLSDGTVVQVFDTKRTALSLLKQMRTIGKTWNVDASEDVLCVAVSYTKMIVCETNLVNQKLFSSFAPIYYGGLLRFLHRSASLVLSLTDTLRSVGLRRVSRPVHEQHGPARRGCEHARGRLELRRESRDARSGQPARGRDASRL